LPETTKINNFVVKMNNFEYINNSYLGSLMYAASCIADADFFVADISPLFTGPERTSAENLA